MERLGGELEYDNRKMMIERMRNRKNKTFFISMEEDVQASFVESIGNTKLLELPSLSAAVGSRVLCKMEYASSSGSVKLNPNTW